MSHKITKLTLIFLLLISLLASPMQGLLVKGASIPKNIHTALPRQITQVEAQWLDEAWHYRVPIEIANPCGSALTDYQVQLTLDDSFDFSHASSDGADVRLTTDDGLTPIPYWIENWDSVGEAASIWVKIPSIPAAGTSLYLYYGNATPPPVPTIEVPPIGPWEKPTNNPIIPSGDPGLGTDLLAENIVYDDATEHYWITFAMYRGDPEVGLAWADDPGDPTDWQWHGSVITDANSPHITTSGSSWYIFYEDLSGTTPYSISVATSTAISGTYLFHSTVLTPTETWEADGVSEPYIFQRTDGKWILLYKGQAGSTERVGYAEADDLLGPYTKYSGNPVINLGPSGYYDAGSAGNPWAVAFDDDYYIGYSASENISSTLQTAYVTTSDWSTFTRRGLVLPTAPPGEWDDANALRGAITRFGDTYYLAYTGGSYQMGLATQPALKALNDPGLVFEFHEPFAGNELTTQWQMNALASGGSFLVGADVITLTAQSSGISGTLQIWGNPLVAANTLLEAYARHPDAGINPGPSETNSAGALGYKTIRDDNLMRLTDFPDLQYYIAEATANGTGSGTITTTIPFDTDWHTYRVFRTAPITGTVQFQVDDSALQTLGPPHVPTAGLRPWLMSFARNPVTTSSFVIDWVRVRQWCGAELNASVGPEEIVLDLAISKSDTPDPVFVGQTLTYTVVMTNTGIMTATSVILTDTLPITATLISATPSQGTCSGTTIISCSLGELAHNTPVTVTIAVTPTVEGTLVNFAEVQTALTEPELANNTISATTTVAPYADLAVNLMDDPDPVFVGELLTYTIAVSNTGPSTASNVTITDTLPTTVTLMSATPSQGSCAGTNPVVCDLGSLPDGGSATVDILLTPTSEGLITNQVEVFIPIHDPEAGNNSTSESTTVLPAADLSVSITDDPDPVFVGNPLTYTVTVQSAGPSAASNVTLTNTLATSVTLDSATPSQGSCAGTAPLVCDFGSLSNGGSATVEIQVTPLMAGMLNLEAEANSSTHDPATGNNTQSEATTVNPVADLSISMSDDPDPVYAGEPLTYTVTVANAGPSTALGVTLNDTLPANTNLISATPSQGSCAGTAPLICNIGSLLNGGSATVVILLTPTVEGSISNQASISASTFDPEAGNNSASEATTVDPAADLSVSITDDPDPVYAGEPLTYMVTVANAGPSSALDVTLDNTLPTTVTLISATPSQGSCAGTAPLICDFGSIANGGSATVEIQVTPTIEGVITSSAEVTSSVYDPDGTNNTQTETTIVNPAADLSVSMSDEPDPIYAGALLTYTITVANAGPSAALSVTLNDTLPANTTLISANPSQGSCAGTAPLVCDLLDIASGSNANIDLVLTPTSEGLITNQVEISSAIYDPNTSNNSALESTTVLPSADLSISIIDSPDPIFVDNDLTYTVTVQNFGPSTALDVVVTDTLPSEVSYVSAVPGQGNCAGTAPIVCSLNNLADGAAASIVIVVTTNQTSTIVNEVQVSSATFDLNLGNNMVAEETIVADAIIDLQISGSDLPDPVIAGETLTYRFDISNLGPSNATSVTFTDTLSVASSFVSSGASQGVCTDLVCELGDIPFGNSAAVTVTATVVPSATGTISNTAIVLGLEPDQNSGDNLTVVETSVDTRADLSITKTDEPDPVIAGELLTYTLNIHNAGPSDAISLTVTDTLPAEVVLITADPICALDGSAVECSLDNLSAGSSTPIMVVVSVDPAFAGTSLVNTAEVSAATFDPDLSDNSDTESTSVNTAADLEILLADTPDPVGAGEMLTYTLTLINHGPSDAVNVDLVDDLPSEVMFTSVTPGSPDCSHLSGVVLCDFANLSAGTSIEVTILVSVSLDTVGLITNEANVDADTADPALANNTATEDTLVMPPDTEAPVVTWLAPVSDTLRYDVNGEEVTLLVNASDNEEIESVSFYRWDAINEVRIDIGTVYSPPYQWDFDTSVLNSEWNEIMVYAYDSAGNSSAKKYIWLYLLPQQNTVYLPMLIR